MSDKPIGALLAAAVVVPLCFACVLGPVAFGTAAAWLAGWFGGLGSMVATGLALFVGLGIYALFRRWGHSFRQHGDAP